MPVVLSGMASLNATASLLPLSKHRERLTCASSSPLVWKKQSRRVISVSFLLSRLLRLPNGTPTHLHFTTWIINQHIDPRFALLVFFDVELDATASSLIDKYVKRKRLDPLEAYVPPVILAQLQFQDLGIFLYLILLIIIISSYNNNTYDAWRENFERGEA